MFVVWADSLAERGSTSCTFGAANDRVWRRVSDSNECGRKCKGPLPEKAAILREQSGYKWIESQ